MLNLKIVIALGGLLVGAAGGSWWTARHLVAPCPEVVIPPCPDCVCPAAVSLQAFDLDKLNNKKGSFTYSPQISDVTIEVSTQDSTWMKEAIREALKK